MIGADGAAGHQGGHQRQHRLLRLPDQRHPRAQVAGVIHPPLGIGSGDLESVGQQRLPGLRAQGDGVGVAVQPGQDPVTQRCPPAVGDFQLPQHSQQFGVAEPVQAQGGHGIGGSDVPGEHLPVGVLIHPSNISSTTDETRGVQPSNPHLHNTIRTRGESRFEVLLSRSPLPSARDPHRTIPRPFIHRASFIHRHRVLVGRMPDRVGGKRPNGHCSGSHAAHRVDQ